MTQDIQVGEWVRIDTSWEVVAAWFIDGRRMITIEDQCNHSLTLPAEQVARVVPATREEVEAIHGNDHS